MRKLLIRLGLGLAGLLTVAIVFGWVYLRTSLPQTRGQIALAELEAPVTITRDRRGIPYIEAETERDAYFALGFVHAQDRLWQMEWHRRVASGRLSEIAGDATVETDTFLRTLSLFDRARRSWEIQDAQTKAMLRAYSDGVNAHLESRNGALPPEFVLARVTPEPWTPIDSLGWLKMMSFDLGGNFFNELARLDLSTTLRPEQVEDFFPPYPGEAQIPLPDLGELYEGVTIEALKTAGDFGRPRGLGSNNWVIDGSRTASGLPLLANDPHLGLNTPSLWYLAHVTVDGRRMAGASMPALPFIMLGRNDRIAWGFTNTAPDVQDLYLEKLTEDGTGYLTPQGPAKFKTRREIIKVRGAEDVEITVRETRHGPVISDAQTEVAGRLPDNAVLALRWTALDAGDTGMRAGREILEADDFASFRRAVSHIVTPQQNIVYADVDGNIGYFAPAKVPIRGPENDARGLVPAPGWKPGYDWQGFIPYSELPRRYNPDDGMIATANEKVVDDSYPHFLTSEWSLPYRGDRIRALIEARGGHDLDSMAAIQMDVRSTLADDLLPLLLGHAGDERADVLEALRAWDRFMTVADPEPLLFTAWHANAARRIYADELGDKFERYFSSKPEFLRRVLAGVKGEDAWCDDVTTEDVEYCAATVSAALSDAMAELEERFGGDWEGWRWGEAHRVKQSHQPMSMIPVLGGLFGLEAPGPGGTYTINVATASFRADPPYSFRHGPSYRAIYDLSDLSASRYMIPTGQSGNPFSRHYSDLMDRWIEGDYLTIPDTLAEAETAAVLRLRPKTQN